MERHGVVADNVRPSLREEQKVLTRNRVLDAAVTAFGEKPFADSTMDDIARAAGVTRATVYAHFAGGKNEILRALVTRMYHSADKAYAEFAASGEWNRAGVRDWLDALAVCWREMAPTIRVLTTVGSAVIRDSDQVGGQYLEAHARYLAMFAGDLRRWPDTSAAEAEQRVMMMVLQVESFLTIWLTGGWQPETADPLDLLTDTVCHLLAPALHD